MAEPIFVDLEDEDRGESIIAELRDHFATIPDWDFECHLSQGAYGVVVRVKKRHSSGRIERLAVKRALGPVIAMEYLENGSWLRLMQRVQAHRIDLPNRLLWSFFLCSDGSAPSTVEHGDLHLSNVMFGSADGRFAEHAIAPVAKFIDLGSMKEGVGVADNIIKIGTRMLNIVVRDQPRRLLRNTTTYNGIETHAFPILPSPTGQKSPNYLLPLLDPDLRDVIARCMAKQEADRPTLPELLRVAENAVRTKKAASYAPNGARETDDAIAEVVRQIIYNAPPPPPPPPPPSPPREPEPVPDPEDPGPPYCFGCWGMTWDINGFWMPV
ncbi:RNA-splicing factor [Diatrype stigma]|uniref:RNA-splicing factor n=1 Tax=Diatrype stigma TaxID=117547 RepID=A0AAN9YUB7_9PEZI